MIPLLIHINSYPGVGKLTIGRLLSQMIGAKLLDNHSIYNVALALTEFKSQAYFDAVSEVRSIAYRLVADLPASVPVILTNAHAQDSDWGNACWDAAIDLARRTGRRHVVVLLQCSREENARRICGPDRDAKRKPRDPAMFWQGATDRQLLDRGADHLLDLETTDLSAEASATAIFDWLVRERLVDGQAAV
ncbi:AAA family ATPase [Halovulum sp. GXIMD14793]